MKQYRVKPGQEVNLKQFDPTETGEFKGGKAEGLQAIGKLTHELESLQEILYAEHLHKVLIVLQAMDTGGKDGTICARSSKALIRRASGWRPSKYRPRLKWIMTICGAFTRKCLPRVR